MAKNSLFDKCVKCDFEKLFAKKGYAYFKKGEYNLNLIGIRANTGKTITNKFDDYLVVIYNNNKGTQRKIYSMTTDPGSYYMKHLANPKGCAILVPNQYRGAWKLGTHKNRYRALVQAKPVKVYRDLNKDETFDTYPETIDYGVFGINIHRADVNHTLTTVDKYSAGCQVLNNFENFTSLIELCKKQVDRYGNSFTYTLITEEDLNGFY